MKICIKKLKNFIYKFKKMIEEKPLIIACIPAYNEEKIIAKILLIKTK